MAGARRYCILWGFISPCHPQHSPLTQLSDRLLSGAPSLAFFSPPSRGWRIPAGHSAWVVSLPLPICPEEGKGRKMQQRASDREEHNVSVDDGGGDVMLTCH